MSFYQRMIRRDVIGLCYHIFSDDLPSHSQHIAAHKIPAQFDADLEYLKAHYELISYEELRRHRKDGRPNRRKPAVIITFDDGLRECLTVAWPLLKKHNVPAVFFITTDWLDNKAMFYRHKVALCIEAVRNMSQYKLPGVLEAVRIAASLPDHISTAEQFADWIKGLDHTEEPRIDEICAALGVDVEEYLHSQRPYLGSAEVQELHQEGFTIGAHTVSHRRLSLLSPEEIEEEICQSVDVIAQLTGASEVPFAFPFSGDGIPRALLAEIRNRHPQLGLMFDRRGFQNDDRFVVQRFVADAPPQGNARLSNVPALFRRGYERQARETMVRAVRRLRPVRDTAASKSRIAR